MRKRLVGGAAVATLAAALGTARGQEPGGEVPAPAAKQSELPNGAIARFGSRRWNHGALCGHVQVSPDGTLIASAGHDERVRLFDLRAGHEVRALVGSPGFVGQLAFTPDGTGIYAGGLDGVVRCWDVTTGVPRFALRAEDVGAEAVAVSPDGHRVASAGNAGGILIWDPGRQTVVAQSATDPGEVLGLVFAGGGTRLISLLGPRTIYGSPIAQVWDPANGAHLFDLSRFGGRLSEVAIAPDGWTAATAGAGNRVELWDLHEGETREPITVGADRHGWVAGLAFVAAGAQLAVATPDGVVRGFDVKSRAEVWRCVDPPPGLQALATDRAGAVLVGHDSRAMHVWSVKTRERLSPLSPVAAELRTALFAPDGRLVLGTQPLQLWNPADGSATAFEATIGDVVWGLAFAGDPPRVVTVGFDRTIRFFDLQTRKQVQAIEPEGARVWLPAVAVLPGGQRLLVGDYNGVVRLWDLASGASHELADIESRVTALVLAPDGTTVVVATDRGASLATLAGDKPLQLAPLPDSRDAVAFAPDGRFLYAAGWRGLARYSLPGLTRDAVRSKWLAARTDPFARPEGVDHDQPEITALAVDPAGGLLAMGWTDGRVELLDLTAGEVMASVPGHADEVRCLRFSLDGTRMVSVSEDLTALAWNVAALKAAGRVALDRAVASREAPDWPPPPTDPDPVPADVAARVDGLYLSPAEVWGFHMERLILKAGTFTYWFVSDVVVRDGPTYPLAGKYSMDGDVLHLHHRDLRSFERTFQVVNGRPVLWRADGLEVWREQRRIHPYGVMIRAEGEDPDRARPPSVQVLQDAELKAREEREYQERYQDAPEPIRTLLRADTERDDPDLAKLRAALDQARRDLDPKLLEQLIYCLGHRSSQFAVTGEMLLEGLLGRPHWQEADPFGGDDGRRRVALTRFSDAFATVKSAQALDSCLLAFLRAVGGGEAAIAVPESGAHIRVSWERTPDGEQTSSNAGTWLEGDPEHDEAAGALLKRAVTAVQAWCRAEVDRRYPEKPAPPASEGK